MNEEGANAGIDILIADSLHEADLICLLSSLVSWGLTFSSAVELIDVTDMMIFKLP